jgi:CMP-N,N'-diacetyllegionaminic acid synthase
VLLFSSLKEQPAGHTVLGLIPARGGSKGIPRKNIRLLGGKPLLSYTASAARESAYLSRVLLSTDEPEIAELGRAEGLDVPFLRPAELALDSTPMIDVVLHCIHWLQGHGEKYDAVCLLQPTSPLRSANTIDRCIAELWARDADCVVSVRPVPTEYNPHWVYFADPDGQLRLSTGKREPIAARQQLPAALHRDGSVFVAKVQGILARQSFYGERMLGVFSPEAEACDLDTEEQWELLEQKLRSVQV